jgi:ParB-like chromosome segregation protein Spo0J
MNRAKPVHLAFEPTSLRIPLDAIEPLRTVSTGILKSKKFAQIAASIQEVGIIEPPVVVRKKGQSEQFLLLDGHLRLHILKERGASDVVCLVATEDEAFTYNKRLSRIVAVQEHRMILNIIERGVSEERLARALNVNIQSIRNKRRLLDGIAPEVAALLKDRPVPIRTFALLRKLRPMRQIEVAEIMIAMNRFSQSYVASLVAATPLSGLLNAEKPALRGISEEQLERMERESATLEREFRLVEKDYGGIYLDLVLALGYLGRMLESVRIVHHLAKHHPEILSEFQKINEIRQAA